MNGFGGERIAYLDKIKFVPIPEREVATMAILNREIDFLLHVPFAHVEKYRKDYVKRGIVLDEIPGQAWYQLWFGCKNPISKDVRFRKACAYAIDQEMVAKAATRGYCIVHSSFVGSANQYFTPVHKEWYKKDVNKAKALLKAKGVNVPMPAPFSGTEFFDQDTTVTAQLFNSDTGTCWTTEFTAAKKNKVDRFKAKSP